jgi:hypothetical protein
MIEEPLVSGRIRLSCPLRDHVVPDTWYKRSVRLTRLLPALFLIPLVASGPPAWAGNPSVCGVAFAPVNAPDVPRASDHLVAVAAAGSRKAWAVGVAVVHNLTPQPLVERGAGVRWRIVATPGLASPAGLNGVASIATDDAWAVGDESGATLAEHWDGSAWSVVPTPNPGGVGGDGLVAVAAATATDVWAVGSQTIGGGAQPLAERWDGSAWSVVPTPDPFPGGAGFSGVAAVDASLAWAVGAGTRSDGSIAPFIERWDGTGWTVESIPPVRASTAELLGVSASAADDVWAAGFLVTRHGRHRALLEHFDGTTWSVIPGAAIQVVLAAVTSRSPTDAWAVGSKGARAVVAEHWDGTAWSLVQTKSPGAVDYALGVAASPSGRVWLTGEFSGPKGNRFDALVEQACP